MWQEGGDEGAGKRQRQRPTFRGSATVGFKEARGHTPARQGKGKGQQACALNKYELPPTPLAYSSCAPIRTSTRSIGIYMCAYAPVGQRCTRVPKQCRPLELHNTPRSYGLSIMTVS